MVKVLKRAGVLLILLLTACVTSRDMRTPAELQLDTETWSRAEDLQVTSDSRQVQGCASLGIVTVR